MVGYRLPIGTQKCPYRPGVAGFKFVIRKKKSHYHERNVLVSYNFAKIVIIFFQYENISRFLRFL